MLLANLLHRLDYADAKKAKELLEQAIQRDPDYARPYALLGLYYGDLWHLWGEERDKNLRRALELAGTAAQLDDSDPTPHAIAALANQFLREFSTAKIEADKALTWDRWRKGESLTAIAVTLVEATHRHRASWPEAAVFARWHLSAQRER